MNEYKKIIKNQDLRFKILKLLKFTPDKLMLSLQYRIKMGRKLNLNNPKRFTEKLQWYKLYDRNPLMTKCADKYTVREYIESKGLKNILNELYGVYENPDEININSLPNKFVIKTTNGSGTNYFCTDKKKFDINSVKEDLKKWLSRDVYGLGREWSYKDIIPKIIIEEFLEDNSECFIGINDYKFMCFNGKPMYVVLDVDRSVGHKRNIYDIEWNLIEVGTDCPNISKKVEKPIGFEEMKKVAERLAEDFPFVRVDLYWVNGKVYFGELTFYPWTGYVQFEPDSFDFELGKEFILPNK